MNDYPDKTTLKKDSVGEKRTVIIAKILSEQVNVQVIWSNRKKKVNKKIPI